MTAVCGGGPSTVRPGVVGQAFNTASGITSFLSNIMDTRLAVAIGAIAALETFDVANYCSTDPPGDPGLTAADMVALLNPGDLTNYLPAVSKVRVWWRHLYWWQVCECSTVATPSPPAPSNPGAQSNNQGLPSGGVVPCFRTTVPYTAVYVASGVQQLDLTSTFLPVTPQRATKSLDFGFGAFNINTVALPPDVTSVFVRSQNGGTASPVGSNVMDGSLHVWSDTADLGGLGQILNSQAAVTGTNDAGALIPTGAKWIGVGWYNTGGTFSVGQEASWSVQIEYRCAGSALSTPCCPPDPALELKINQVLQLLLNIQNPAVSNPPISWHDGTRHSNLRGAGSFTINAAAIGMRFEVTTPPTGTKVDPGNPDFYWDMGFWTPYALTSPLRGGRLVFLRQSVELPEFTDQIGYTLKHGTVMDAVELLPTTS